MLFNLLDSRPTFFIVQFSQPVKGLLAVAAKEAKIAVSLKRKSALLTEQIKNFIFLGTIEFLLNLICIA